MLSSSMYGITVLCTVYGGELCFIFVTTWQMSSFGGCVGSTTVCSRVFYHHNCDICGLRRLWEMTSRKKEKTNHVFAPDSRQHVLLSGTRSGGEGTLRPSRAVTVHLTFNPRSNIHRKGISFKFKDCELLTKYLMNPWKDNYDVIAEIFEAIPLLLLNIASIVWKIGNCN